MENQILKTYLLYVLLYASWNNIPFLVKTENKEKYRYHYEYYIG